MPWAKMDDHFDDDPETDLVGPVAVCLFVCAITWCSRNLTDGFVPAARIPKLSGGSDPGAMQRLIQYRWIVPSPDGYLIRSYLKYNPSAEQVLKEREANGRRQQRFQDKKRSGRGHKTAGNGNHNGVIDSVSNSYRNELDDALLTPVPESRVPLPDSRIPDLESIDTSYDVDVYTPAAREHIPETPAAPETATRGGVEQSSFPGRAESQAEPAAPKPVAWGETKTATVRRICLVTGEDHSRSRWGQLYDLAEKAGQLRCVEAAIREVGEAKRSGRDIHLGKLMNKILPEKLIDAGVDVPVGTLELRAEARAGTGELRALLAADAESDPDPRGESP